MTTNANQFEIMVSFMERNEGIANNFLNAPQYKDQTNKLWDQATKQLNDEGPPVKTVAGWKKVWKDYKYTVKAKIRANKKSYSGTGGGPCKIQKINPLEERLDKVLDITGAIEGINAEEFGCSTSTHLVLNNCNNKETTIEIGEIPANIETDNVEAMPLIEAGQERTTTTTKKKPKETPKELKQQLKMQETFYKNCENYQKTKIRVLKDIRNTNNDLLKCNRDSLKFNREKWLAKQKLLIQRLKQKAEQLEVQKLELELKRDLNHENI